LHLQFSLDIQFKPAITTDMSSFSSPGPVAAHSSSLSSVGTAVVSRSDELLSCARTAVKLALRQHPGTSGWWDGLNPASLTLHSSYHHKSASSSSHHPLHAQPSAAITHESLEDGLTLLRTMERQLQQLEGLVKRRGQTNDPTEEITRLVQRLEMDAADLNDVLHHMIPPTVTTGQRYKHWQMVQQWFQHKAQAQGEQLQRILKIRSQVVAEQAQRRQQFRPSARTGPSHHANDHHHHHHHHHRASSTSNVYNNPLFTLTPPTTLPAATVSTAPLHTSNSHTSIVEAAPSQPVAPAAAGENNHHSEVVSAKTSSAPSTTPSRIPTSSLSSPLHHPSTWNAPAGGSLYYGSSSMGDGGYGYGYGGTTGMRHRKGGGVRAMEDTSHVPLEQEQLLVRQQERQTQKRLAEARQAEKSLAELGTLFGKMTVRT
jgi:hypothetical protein